ncbi:hypothetical protein R1flu_027208 [Riccia fluitans]|uniref:Uncharacterized protein n=1 Tax=Riccia fluitans TaxID=41844 RepID=A0ABD1XIN5_9MARC
MSEASKSGVRPEGWQRRKSPSAVETSSEGKLKEKITESSHRPDVDTNVDIPVEDRRTLKIRMMASLLEMDPPLGKYRQDKLLIEAVITYPTGDTKGTKVSPAPTSSKVPSDGILEESVEPDDNRPCPLSNIIEHHARKNQCLASLEEDLADAKLGWASFRS